MASAGVYPCEVPDCKRLRRVEALVLGVNEKGKEGTVTCRRKPRSFSDLLPGLDGLCRADLSCHFLVGIG